MADPSPRSTTDRPPAPAADPRLPTCLDCGMPVPHHSESCPRHPEAPSRGSKAPWWASSWAIFLFTGILIVIAFLQDPWYGEGGGGNPLLWLAAPGVLTGLLAAQLGLPAALAWPVGVGGQWAACKAVARGLRKVL